MEIIEIITEIHILKLGFGNKDERNLLLNTHIPRLMKS